MSALSISTTFRLIKSGSAMPEFGVPAYEPFLRSGRYRPVTSQAVFINDGGNVALGM